MKIIKNTTLFIAVLVVSTVIVGQIRGYYSDGFENFLIGIFLSILVVYVWGKVGKKPGNTVKRMENNYQGEGISEEVILEIQTDFEGKLQETYLPDAITYKDLYIFKHLMRDWYVKLAGSFRYDDSMIQKIRKDWLDYMSSLKDRNISNYLSLELEDNQEQNSCRNKEINASRKVMAIEDAYASLIGEGAEKELNKIRELSLNKFSVNGEMAPEGYKYNLNDELSKEVPGEKDIDFEALFEDDEEIEDALYEKARAVVMEGSNASTSFVQKKLKVGYARAAHLLDMLEENGVVSEASGYKPRRILKDK